MNLLLTPNVSSTCTYDPSSQQCKSGSSLRPSLAGVTQWQQSTRHFSFQRAGLGQNISQNYLLLIMQLSAHQHCSAPTQLRLPQSKISPLAAAGACRRCLVPVAVSEDTSQDTELGPAAEAGGSQGEGQEGVVELLVKMQADLWVLMTVKEQRR